MLDDLESRLGRLDSALIDGVEIGAAELSHAFVATMSAVSFRGTPAQETKIVDPVEADGRVRESRFLNSLLIASPWLATGPSSSECTQNWISTGKPSWRPQGDRTPSLTAFRPPSVIDARSHEGHPGEFGLYTSSATQNYSGMWRDFLDIHSGVLWPRPWSTWRMQPSSEVSICLISCAEDWVKLLEEHHVKDQRHLRPDWRSVARVFDAVHFSPHAISAAEGYRLRTRLGLTAPVYWDVESTVWLRWCFESTELISTDERT